MPDSLSIPSLLLFGAVLGWIGGLVLSRPGRILRMAIGIFTMAAGALLSFLVCGAVAGAHALLGAGLGLMAYAFCLSLLQQTTTR